MWLEARCTPGRHVGKKEEGKGAHVCLVTIWKSLTLIDVYLKNEKRKEGKKEEREGDSKEGRTYIL